MARIRPFPRRAFLRGMGGFAMALPALEIMAPRRASAGGAAAPQRYVVGFCGLSIATYSSLLDTFVPGTIGVGYELTPSLMPLGDLASEVSVVTGLKIPWDTGSGIPTAGRDVIFHEHYRSGLLAGTANDDNGIVGSTSDHVVADALAGDTMLRSLPVCVQAKAYRDIGPSLSTSSYKDSQIVTPFASPRLLYESLFSGFVPTGGDPAAVAEAEYQLARRRSVVDLVKSDASRLVAELGGTDRQRMERHFDEIRALETKLDMLEPLPAGACVAPEDPGEDPAIGVDMQGGGGDFDTTSAWSDEETRAILHTDLVYMALACDLTRSVALQYTYPHSWLNVYPLTNYLSDVHGVTHTSPTGVLSQMVAWHVGHWARLIAKLRDATDFDGASILDNVASVLLFEGGYGYDPEAGDDGSPHSTENMAVLVAGRAGGLNGGGGRHIVATGEHPAKVITSAMSAIGAGDTLGDVSGTFPELFA